ncbi:MAG: ATP-binding protein [Bacteroidales bacterium]|nr:ATP-binding protein [Bacteroidales bacterium]
MPTRTFDFTPDPRVLIALTQTPIKPLDALCELIDNSIDAFYNGLLKGEKPEQQPTITIELPTKNNVKNGMGVLKIKDNGSGMTAEQTELSIKAGYSGNNAIDTLGLFGMGFNISTGKLGIKTRIVTARKQDPHCTSVTIDLEEINKSRSYELEAELYEKPMNLVPSGTLIEISKWWPAGHANNGFIDKLIQYGAARIREELGRRYATILREKKIAIIVDKVPCEAFEHCVWSEKRYVTRKNDKIPAQYRFSRVLTTKTRCAKCRAFIPENATECPLCKSKEFRSVDELISGWVGIQRFDDTNRYGIDLIRNGRAIKIGEKTAFFDFVDEFQNTIKDYPIDGICGRIVGEVNLDFVPVDFLKQDFQRSSEEWQRAISYLRGNSSLQPNQPGADANKSPIFKLYQGYRKVRIAGTTDMYMGYWSETENKPKRISREKEAEMYKKFLDREEGYFDDSEWWKLVEAASQPPTTPMVTCSQCGSQNTPETEICIGCGAILKGKKCLNPECGKEIALSAVTCPHCGKSQVPQVTTPWRCDYCGTRNQATENVCRKCGIAKGTPNPLTLESLLKSGIKDDSLSVPNLSIKLCNGTQSNSFNLETYYTEKPLEDLVSHERTPLVVFASVNGIAVFVDQKHPIFTSSNTTVVEMVANQAASYIFDLHRTLASNPLHSVSNIAWYLIQKFWMDQVEVSTDTVTKKAESLLSSLKESLANNINQDLSYRLFDEMNELQLKLFISQMLNSGVKPNQIELLKQTGSFIRFTPNDFILSIYDAAPELFFNGNFWTAQYGIDIPGFPKANLTQVFSETLNYYRNSLEAVVLFLGKKSRNFLELKQIDAILNFLQANISESAE